VAIARRKFQTDTSPEEGIRYSVLHRSTAQTAARVLRVPHAEIIARDFSFVHCPMLVPWSERHGFTNGDGVRVSEISSESPVYAFAGHSEAKTHD
jgi:hypothetical protein